MLYKKGAKKTSAAAENQTGTRDIGQGKSSHIRVGFNVGVRWFSCCLTLNKRPSYRGIQNTITPGTLIYTNEYSIYARLVEWGYSPTDKH